MKIGVSLLATFIVLIILAMLTRTGWDRPPVASEQRGYRGLGMVQINNPRTAEAKLAANQVPEPLAAVPSEGPTAGTTYQNVQVLKDLSVAEFTRLMVAITNWVAPEQGCNYCHDANDLASDSLYTKVVARRMLQMTQYINSEWKDHVADTGVTCYTCHRGKPVPANIWFSDPGPAHANSLVASRYGQNLGAASVGSTSLPYDPFTPFLGKDSNIRVVSTTALPAGNTHNIKQTEWTYGLMIHMSKSLGVNCTYCHNSRSFLSWDQSTPQRTTAWYGIRLVRDLNTDYLGPLGSEFPPNRLGPGGDVPKVNCSTCHQGAYKPLLGVSMLKDYPSLGGGAAASQPAEAAGAEAVQAVEQPAETPETTEAQPSN